MSFTDQWRVQLNDSLVKSAKLATTAPGADLKYQLMIVGLLWPIRQPVLDFDFEAMEAVRELTGDQGKHILKMMQRWEGDQLAVAQSLSARALQSGQLDAALKKLITHFDAFRIFAGQLAGQSRSAGPPASPEETPTQPSLGLPRVLVSYVRKDGEALAAEVYERLRVDGIPVWADLTRFEGTRDWWQQITQALDIVDFLVLVMTPAALQSETVRKQWRYAQQKGVCIYPVAKSLDLDFSQLPHWIRQIHFYNLNIEWSKLIKNLKGKCQTPSIPFMAEDLPSDFVERPAELQQIMAHLFDSERQDSIPGTIALHGPGGSGKTVLTHALCHNDDIRQVFNNGILWVTLSENPGDLSRYVIDLIEALSGERPGFTGLDAAVGRLGELLADRDILLVIDDVWNAAHLKPFLHAGPRCARLITTRDISVLPPEAKTVTVGAMQLHEATALLSSELPFGHPRRIRQLAGHLGEWPLLLKLANGALRDRVYKNRERLSEALTYVDNALSKHGVAAFDSQNPIARDQAISKTLDISLELLDDAERTRYNELAIFPEDVQIPLATLEKLWGATGGLDDFDTEELCDHLHELSLVSHLDLTTRYVRLHKVVQSYLVYRQSSNLSTLHNQFLDACRPPLSIPPKKGELEESDWPDMSPEEPYLWTYLAYHLIEANRPAELVSLVKNLRYLAAKTHARGVNYAEIDLTIAEDAMPDDTALPLLRRVLSQTSHLLVRCKTLNEVANILHSRLLHLPALAPIAVAAEPDLPRPLLTARHVLPDQPDPTLVRTLRGHTAGAMDCAVSADGSTTVSIAKDSVLAVWDTETGAMRFNLTESQADIWGCNINADGDVAVASLSDGGLALWNLQTGKKLLSWSGHLVGAVSCAVNADASIVVSASKDKTLKVWDAQTGTERFTLTGHQRTVTSCDISADGTVIVSASNDGTVKVWDAQTGILRFTHMVRLVNIGIDRLTFLSQRDISFNCAISANGALVVATSSMGAITILDAKTGDERFTFTGDKRGVNGCALNADGIVMVCALNSGALKTWNTTTGDELLTMADHTRVVNDCAISADGSIVISASDDKTLKVWDAQSKTAGLVDISHTGSAHSCAISADGNITVSAMANKMLKVWDVTNAAEISTLRGHTRKVNGCAISTDGSTVVSASQDQTLIIWDAKTGDRRLRLTGHTWAINGCAISDDGATVISASEDKTLKVWDVRTGAERFTLLGHTRTVNDCIVSAGGQIIISTSGDGTLKVWDAQTGAKRFSLRGHTSWVNSCAASADGSVIVSASYDKSLKIWQTDDQAERCTLQGHTATVTGCAISADGDMAVSVSRDKTIRVWNAETGDCLTTLFVNEPLLGCACSANANSIVAVGSSGIYFLRLER